ncbi:hypothetical protein ASPBRDRAFT_667326 [Aspergillus brasiliensis CBS 101740]|uniref:Xylanolytic transcriptional activator regulatory domain-containing protein n=1 Tax=Aspergillus brasiliensis (strain CBS 101740 / IMI 381727 / IBT 21946) TaxID=767769 RepID=A0A1L9U289_ASPBC|nr:hypothetical protein ASPBRDRAFT_667326 [Aspergillus brasiliensis CBS 101740]
MPCVSAVYRQSWRPPYSSDDRYRHTTAHQFSVPQAALFPNEYSVLPVPELSQRSEDDLCGREGRLIDMIHNPAGAPPPFSISTPMSDTLQEPTPHFTPPGYRLRVPFSDQDSNSNIKSPSCYQHRTEVPVHYPTLTPEQQVPALHNINIRENKTTGICRPKARRAQEKRPTCERCKDQNLRCGYAGDSVRNILERKDKATQLLLDRIIDMEDGLNEKLERLSAIQIETSAQLSRLSECSLLKPRIVKRKETETKSRTQVLGHRSIPINHTMASNKLLSWPSIKALIGPREYDEDHIIELEEERGISFIQGRCQKRDACSIRTGPNLKALDPGIDEHGLFGTDAKAVRRYYQSYMNHIHKLHPFLSPTEMSARIKSFIRKYCPFDASIPVETLNSYSTNNLPHGVKRKSSWKEIYSAGPVKDYLPGLESGGFSGRHVDKSLENAIILSILALGSICEVQVAIPGLTTDTPADLQNKRTSEPSIRGTLISEDTGLVFQLREGYNYSSSAAVKDQNNDPDRSMSWDYHHFKSVDVMPGLAYYIYAAQILGSFQGANGLHYVQAALLAGLYVGQLALPFQSHGWINQAARACQVLVRSKRYEQVSDSPLKDMYDFAYWTCLQLESDILADLNLPASGISHSEGRIGLPKGQALYLSQDGFSSNSMGMFIYSAQIHLTRILNRLNSHLYTFETGKQGQWSAYRMGILSMNLEQWRKDLPESMTWKDIDPPSPDINVAQMRAKYYSARYLIHRPLLYYALHHSSLTPCGRSMPVPSLTTSGEGLLPSPLVAHGQGVNDMSQLPTDVNAPDGTVTSPDPHLAEGPWTRLQYYDLNPEVRRACKLCVESAILSTQAFDAIEGRPVVTNIFGLAHA